MRKKKVSSNKPNVPPAPSANGVKTKAKPKAPPAPSADEVKTKSKRKTTTAAEKVAEDEAVVASPAPAPSKVPPKNNRAPLKASKTQEKANTVMAKARPSVSESGDKTGDKTKKKDKVIQKPQAGPSKPKHSPLKSKQSSMARAPQVMKFGKNNDTMLRKAIKFHQSKRDVLAPFVAHLICKTFFETLIEDSDDEATIYTSMNESDDSFEDGNDVNLNGEPDEDDASSDRSYENDWRRSQAPFSDSD